MQGRNIRSKKIIAQKMLTLPPIFFLSKQRTLPQIRVQFKEPPLNWLSFIYTPLKVGENCLNPPPKKKSHPPLRQISHNIIIFDIKQILLLLKTFFLVKFVQKTSTLVKKFPRPWVAWSMHFWKSVWMQVWLSLVISESLPSSPYQPLKILEWLTQRFTSRE